MDIFRDRGSDSQGYTKRADSRVTKQIDLGGGVSLEVVYIPLGEFKLGSTPAENAWATGVEGGAVPGTDDLDRRLHNPCS